jgi:hypothetical protein
MAKPKLTKRTADGTSIEKVGRTIIKPKNVKPSDKKGNSKK